MPLKFRGKVYFGGVTVASPGTNIREILCGSVSGCYDAVGASEVSNASFIVSGMTDAYKVFLTQYEATDSCNVTITRVVPGTDVITASFANFVGTDVANEGTATIHYLAIKDLA